MQNPDMDYLKITHWHECNEPRFIEKCIQCIFSNNKNHSYP